MVGALFGFTLIVLTVWRLLYHFDKHTPLERISLSMIGAGATLLLPTFLSAPNPFSNWAIDLSTAGTALFILATFRKVRHG